MKIILKAPRISLWMIISIVLAMALAIILLQGKLQITGAMVLPKEKIGERVISYISNSLVPGGGVSLVSVEDMGSFYKILTSYKGRCCRSTI